MFSSKETSRYYKVSSVRLLPVYYVCENDGSQMFSFIKLYSGIGVCALIHWIYISYYVYIIINNDEAL